MKLLTVATHSAGAYSALQESAKRAGLELITLGWERGWRGLNQKLHLVTEALESLEAEETVLFVDAHDTILIGSGAEIEAKFRALGDPFLCSAERNCYPVAEWAERYPPCDTPYRFLNSGVWMGEVGFTRALFEQMQVARLPAELNDQRLFTEWWLSYRGFTLDRQCTLFQSLFGAEQDLVFEGLCLRNVLTGTYPLVLHGNGRTDMSAVITWAKLPEGDEICE